MNDSMLRKEFAPRDVQRMRNILTGKVGDKTQLQTGWERQSQTHKEGDVWEEGGKQWTIKNGIKQSVTKQDAIKRLVVMPLACPTCSKPMKADVYNKKMWAIHGECFDCVIKKESEIKRLGKWDEYCSGIMNKNKNAEIEDLEKALTEWATQSETYVSEAGDIEKWRGGDKTQIEKQLKEGLSKFKDVDIYKQN